MISDKKHIQQLAALLIKKEITNIVISPGSRNAPMINTFVEQSEFNCRSIVDERSAAYFALGWALNIQKPVALVCSSGTATLNYAPAVAEAFYQHIPLILLTADRPGYWIDQLENQCINQKDIYKNFSKKSISLPLGESEAELWYAARQINESLNIAITGTSAPVHINIPLEEPLHNLADAKIPEVRSIETVGSYPVLSETEMVKLTETIQQSKKILIVAGQQTPNQAIENSLSLFCKKTGAVVLTEYLSNLTNEQFCNSIDLLLSAINKEQKDFRADLLISFGGTLVSKAIKQFIRTNKPMSHWHLCLTDEHFDTYQSLTKVIDTDIAYFFDTLYERVQQKENSYQQIWKNKEQQVNAIRDLFISEIPFCDLKVFTQIASSIPNNSVVHLGNSSPVRYALMCNPGKNTLYFGNRGTSGIDGCVSTAVGFASDSKKINTIIVGDLSFFYDSNALWNKYLSANLRVIVVNNGGGNIFSLINDSGKSLGFNQYLFAENPYNAEGIANVFNLDYFSAKDERELLDALAKFYSPFQQKPALLEIFTQAESNTAIFKEIFKKIKQ